MTNQAALPSPCFPRVKIKNHYQQHEVADSVIQGKPMVAPSVPIFEMCLSYVYNMFILKELQIFLFLFNARSVQV
jgi:hypothetical protein